MYQLKYTPTVEEFANVSAAATLFGGFLIKTTFSSLLSLVPKRVGDGLILVFAGLMSVPQHPTVHRIAKTLGIKSHDSLERCVMHKSWTVGCIMTALMNYLVTMLSGTPAFGYLILDDLQGILLMLDNMTPHVSVPVQAIGRRKAKGEGRNIESEDGAMAVVITTTLSDEKGKYRLINLKPGRYQLRCQVLGGYVYYPSPNPKSKVSTRLNPRIQNPKSKMERGVDDESWMCGVFV